MQLVDGRFVYSATDLNKYLECEHLVALERGTALGELSRPERNETVQLLAEKGLEHERRYLEELRAEHGDVVEIAAGENSWTGLETAATRTVAAMEAGARVIYQGTFFNGQFVGKTDFLLRVERPCARWAWSYEVADTKLALHDKPYFIVQLCHYSEHVARVQGTAPVHMHVVLGSGEPRRFRVDDFAAYYRHLKASFLARGASGDAYPWPCGHCEICDWKPECLRRREADDHLSLVALMQRQQVKKFESAGITTMTKLAQSNGAPPSGARPNGVSPNGAPPNGLPPNGLPPNGAPPHGTSSHGSRPHGMQEATYVRLRRQAALQVRGRETGAHHYELLEPPPAGGFSLLPEPAIGDVFFDMEGDPYYEIGTGLEYLFGCYCPDEDDGPFHAFWGTDRAGEGQAFEACIDFLVERRKRYPNMHVYHYAAYEKTALRKLAQRHGTREDEVDDLLRGDVLVDLYAVVRQSLAISQPSYSIKKLEPFYGMARRAALRRGDDSVVMFERWLKAPEGRNILDEIERYNEEDCRSTALLREWLLDRRLELKSKRGLDVAFRPRRSLGGRCHEPSLEGCQECARRAQDERERAKITQLQHELFARERDPIAPLLGGLASYHRREEKPAWWKLFDRCENVDQLIEFDKEALGGLALCREVAPYKRRASDRNLVYTYTFPEQDHHLKDNPCDPRTRKGAGEIVALDDDANRVALKRSGTLDDAAQITALIPGGPVVGGAQKSALARIGAAYLNGTLASRHRAAVDILERRPPRLLGHKPGANIQPHEVTDPSVYALVKALDRSALFIQGPPGSGKTHIGARVIVRLLAAGKTIGVMANNHKAIHHLLHEVEAVALSGGVRFNGLHKHSNQNPDSPYLSELAVPMIGSADNNELAENGDLELISGNAWLFAREGMIDRLDYLFIDEAGQTSLADAIAVAASAQNVVLLGDPMQLAQVTQGVHPHGAGLSVLQHLLGDASTVSECRGVLLDRSFRMQPEICDFISASVYDGRLQPAPATANNSVESPGLCGGGLRYIPVAHEGNGRESVEEADRIVSEVQALLRGRFTRNEKRAVELTARDILIVTPYNAQRKKILASLAAAGITDVEVGTVDKFQGKEAPVVFYSMATSSGEDVPRTLEFLFERNRFNVAVSRAQCLCVLVCSPRLLDVRCNHVEQMALVNLLCRFAERAGAEETAPIS